VIDDRRARRAAYMRAYRSDPDRREQHNAATREWKRCERSSGAGKMKDKLYRVYGNSSTALLHVIVGGNTQTPTQDGGVNG
jgi:hypothetical protein